VSNYRFTYNAEDKSINIPIEINFDMEGREQAIETYEQEIKLAAINEIKDFELTRFSHSPWETNNNKTEIWYKFNFFNPFGNTNFLTTPPASNQWLDDYQYATFTDEEIYYFANSFKKSFYKMDFYDNTNSETQKLMFSVILPTQQGQKESGNLFNNPNLQVLVKKPLMVLDFIGSDKEGFFLYWLKNQTFLSQTEFYMSCKFYNAKIGQFVRMMNTPQSSFNGPNIYDFNKGQYFYYKVVIDYDNYMYSVFREIPVLSGTPLLFRVGDGSNNPINWYEYVNP
jgi:hypothetical protein